MKSVLGGKGANLAEMTNLGVPVPPGFTIACAECIEYLQRRQVLRTGCAPRSKATSRGSRRRPARSSATRANPLLVSVRSGAAVSMPGMMETILNLGLNDRTVDGSRASRAATRASPTIRTGASSRCTPTSCSACRSTTSSTCSRRSA